MSRQSRGRIAGCRVLCGGGREKASRGGPRAVIRHCVVTPRSPRLAAHLQIAHSLAWGFFLGASAALFAVVAFGIGEAQIREWAHGGDLQAALFACSRSLDAAWIALAAANTYLFAAKIEGLKTARPWTLLVLAGGAILSWLGAKTGAPFGPMAFTDNLGARIGGVLPWGVPFLWLVLVVNSRYVALLLRPRAAHWPLAIFTAATVALLEAAFEPVAAHVRFYWLWQPLKLDPNASAPWQNSAAWFCASLLFAGCFRGSRALPHSRRQLMRPAWIAAAFLLPSLAAFFARR